MNSFDINYGEQKMTHIIIGNRDGGFIYQYCEKSPDEICRDIELGVFPFPVPMTDPTAVRQRDYLLVTERDVLPILSKNQREILELLAMGASETEIGKTMGLSFSGVRHHVERLKQKFNVTTREELIALYCRRWGR